MGLVHDTCLLAFRIYRDRQLTENDLGLIGIFLSKQAPNTSKLSSAILLELRKSILTFSLLGPPWPTIPPFHLA
jgi:hypothetical protein